MTNPTVPSFDEQIELRTRIRALVASAIGSTVEWYDYFLYGTMAGIVFGPLFFPAQNRSVSLLLSLASFALAFLHPPRRRRRLRPHRRPHRAEEDPDHHAVAHGWVDDADRAPADLPDHRRGGPGPPDVAAADPGPLAGR